MDGALDTALDRGDFSTPTTTHVMSLGDSKMFNGRLGNNTKRLFSVYLQPSAPLTKVRLRALSGSVIVNVVNVALREWCGPVLLLSGDGGR